MNISCKTMKVILLCILFHLGLPYECDKEVQKAYNRIYSDEISSDERRSRIRDVLSEDAAKMLDIYLDTVNFIIDKTLLEPENVKTICKLSNMLIFAEDKCWQTVIENNISKLAEKLSEKEENRLRSITKDIEITNQKSTKIGRNEGVIKDFQNK